LEEPKEEKKIQVVEEIKEQPKYPEKTRRWGKQRTEPPSKKNNFVQYAGLFFYPLVKDFDNP